MVKKMCISFSVILLLLISSPAFCGDGPYFSANYGLAMASDSDLIDPAMIVSHIGLEYDNGYAFGAALGYDFGMLGLEGEVSFQKNDLSEIEVTGNKTNATGDCSVLSFLINSYFSFNFGKFPVVPYITAGIGYAQISINDFYVAGTGWSTWNDDDNVFAYQFGAGIDWDLTRQFTLGVRYRYFGASEPEFGTSEAEFSSHNFLGIVRMSF